MSWVGAQALGRHGHSSGRDTPATHPCALTCHCWYSPWVVALPAPMRPHHLPLLVFTLGRGHGVVHGGLLETPLDPEGGEGGGGGDGDRRLRGGGGGGGRGRGLRGEGGGGRGRKHQRLVRHILITGGAGTLLLALRKGPLSPSPPLPLPPSLPPFLTLPSCPATRPPSRLTCAQPCPPA